MGKSNKHGLSRAIPETVKLEVRQRCGFGCVRCGLGFYDYEHFAPDFKDALKHDATGITLLCMQCNQKRARGLLSAETVAQANAAPRCLEEGFTREEWGFGSDPIEMVVAGSVFTNVEHAIAINGRPLLSVRIPEDGSRFYRLSGLFADCKGKITLRIEENEWHADIGNWDIQCVGRRITIRNGPRSISLVLRSEPPRRIVVEKLHMQYQNVLLKGNLQSLQVSFDKGRSWGIFEMNNIADSPYGIHLATS